MRISDWSSDVCSSDLLERRRAVDAAPALRSGTGTGICLDRRKANPQSGVLVRRGQPHRCAVAHHGTGRPCHGRALAGLARSEEHTSELQSLMRISYAVFCLKTKKKYKKDHTRT